MGVASTAEYEGAIRKLFPQGEYWDRQFADPGSDVSLFCKAKAPELARFRQRIQALQDESFPETTEELIADWERVLLDSVFPGLSLVQRRLQLNSMWNLRLNRAELRKIAAMYELAIADVYFPYRPGFLGFSRYRNSFIGSPVTWSVLFLIVQQQDFRKKSWALIKPDYPAKVFGRMRFGLDRLVYFPVYRLRLDIHKKLREHAFGFSRFGTSRVFHLAAVLNVDDFSAKLKESAFGFFRCGASRMFPPAAVFNSNEYTQKKRFFLIFERALIDYMLREKRPFRDFEQSIENILLANHIPYFFYKEAAA